MESSHSSKTYYILSLAGTREAQGMCLEAGHTLLDRACGVLDISFHSKRGPWDEGHCKAWASPGANLLCAARSAVPVASTLSL